MLYPTSSVAAQLMSQLLTVAAFPAHCHPFLSWREIANNVLLCAGPRRIHLVQASNLGDKGWIGCVRGGLWIRTALSRRKRGSLWLGTSQLVIHNNFALHNCCCCCCWPTSSPIPLFFSLLIGQGILTLSGYIISSWSSERFSFSNSLHLLHDLTRR